jgi:hypothetical protein
MSNFTYAPFVCTGVPLDACYQGQLDTALTAFNNSFQCYQNGCVNGSSCSQWSNACTFYNVVQNDYLQLVGVLNQILDNTAPLNIPNYDSSMNTINTNYQALLALRKAIDAKMNELNQTNVTKTGVPNLYKIDYDVTGYTGVLWVILATSLVYFTFLKIRDE